MSDVTAVILCGGLGTRLRPAVSDVPKCLAEVNGKPFIFYILDQLVEAKIQHVILSIGYKGYMICDVIGFSYKNLMITYSTDIVTNGGTGAALRSALKYIDRPTVLIMNGDTYIDFKIFDFLYGYQVQYGNTGFVLNVYDGIISMGMYLIHREFIQKYIPLDMPYSLEQSFLNDVYEYGVVPYIINRPFIDIGTPEAYAKAGEFMGSFTG
jgi:D-glycero-alpha-D-manno-heptose 1-phosphate guanylyltransferase